VHHTSRHRPLRFVIKRPSLSSSVAGGRGRGEGEEEERKEKERKKKEEKLYTDLRLRISTSNLTSKLLVRHYAPLGLLKGVAYIYIYIYVYIYIFFTYILVCICTSRAPKRLLRRRHLVAIVVSFI